MRWLVVVLILASCAAPRPEPISRMETPTPRPTGPLGKKLAELVNAYRVSRGLPAVPFSPTMQAVAAEHVHDLVEHPTLRAQPCTLHSWTPATWPGCCYTYDHAQAGCMWLKPGEVGAYYGMTPHRAWGFEVAAYWHRGTPEQVMSLFDGSPGHRDVLLNAGPWSYSSPWPAMGAAMDESGVAAIWFSDGPDAHATPTPAPTPTAGKIDRLQIRRTGKQAEITGIVDAQPDATRDVVLETNAGAVTIRRQCLRVQGGNLHATCDATFRLSRAGERYQFRVLVKAWPVTSVRLSIGGQWFSS